MGMETIPELLWWFTFVNELLVFVDSPLDIECAGEYSERSTAVMEGS
jgi:hypothetical protein